MTTEAANPAASARRFGHGLTFRARRQSVLARRRPAARLIGAVGKSSIGFGLAVGRSRSIRPVVRRSDLNSPALRPPPGFWHEHLHGNDEVESAVFPGQSPVESGEASSRTTSSARPDAASRAASAPSIAQRPRVQRIATTPITTDPPAAATWTDQVIERSAVGYVRPSSQTFTPAPKAPDDFVSSGNSKLDDLRLLLAAKEEGSTPAVRRGDRTNASIDRRAATRSSDSGDPDIDDPGVAADGVAGVGGVRGDTAAGHATGPGRLARSVVPESAVAGTALTSGRGRRGTSRTPQAPGVPTVPLGGEAQPRRTQRPQRSTPAQRMDDLRVLLESKGLLPETETDDGSGSVANDATPQGRPDSQSATSRGQRSGGAGHSSRPADSERADIQRSTESRRSTRRDRGVTDDDPRAGGSGSASGSIDRGGMSRASSVGADHQRPDLAVDSRAGGTASSADTTPGPGSAGLTPSSVAVLERAPIDIDWQDGPSDRVSVVNRIQRLAQMRRQLIEPLASAEALTSSTSEREAGGTVPSERTDSETRPPTAGRRATAATASPNRRSAEHTVVGPDPIEPDVVIAPTELERSVVEPSVVSAAASTNDVNTGVPPLRRSAQADAEVVDVSDLRGAEQMRVDGSDLDVHAPLPSVVGLPGIPGSAGTIRRRLAIPRALSRVFRPSNSVEVGAESRIVRRTRLWRQHSDAPVPTLPVSTPDHRTAAPINSTRDAASATPGRAAALTDQPGAVPSRRIPQTGEPSLIEQRRSDDGQQASTSASTETPQRARVEPNVVSTAASTERRLGRRSADGGTERVVDYDASGAAHRISRRWAESVVSALPIAPPVTNTSAESDLDASTASNHTSADAARIGTTVPSAARSGSVQLDSGRSVRRGDRRRSAVIAGPGALTNAIRRTRRNRSLGVARTEPISSPTRPASDTPPVAPTVPTTSGSSVAHPTSRERTADVRDVASTEPAAAIQRVTEVVTAQRDEIGTDTRTRRSTSGPRPTAVPEANDVAQAFMTELSQTIQRRPAPLPVSFQPMADAITGGRGRNVRLSTDNASRRALRKVGKVAATTDNVIHLAEAPAPSARLNEVIAHELTHIANPSPVARFFDDADDSPEEREAERVARVMASSPIAPTVSTPAARPGAKPNAIRRTPATSTTTGAPSMSDATGSISAAGLAASITGRSVPTGAPDVQRLAEGATAAAAPASGAPSLVSSREGRSALPLGSQLRDDDTAAEWFSDQLERNFDWLVTALEDRMIVEFERRGGRLWEGL